MEKQTKNTRGRMSFVYGVSFLAFSTLLLRLGYLQVNRGVALRSQASNQQVSYVPVLPARGWIYDSNHQLLADDTPSMSIVLTRLHSKYQDFGQLATLLSPILNIPVATLIDKMNNFNTWENQIYLAQNVSDTVVTYVSEHKSELPGVDLVTSSQRNYPNGQLASQALGYVGAISAEDVKSPLIQKNYILTQIIGKDGLEKEYEPYLQGKVGEYAVVINNRGIPLQNLGLSPAPQQGDTLNLSLDGHLQEAAQQAIDSMITNLNTKQGLDVKHASVVAIDVKTGGVLAMLSYPNYDPNWFVDPKLLSQHAKNLSTFNGATQGMYTPGSTVKPANIMLGLLKGAITPQTIVDDTGGLQIGNYFMRGDEAGGAGLVDPVRTIEVSDDIFMYQLSLWLAHWPPTNISVATWIRTLRTQAINDFHNFEKEWGLGVQTGIDLPTESVGLFADNKTLYDLPATAIGQDQAFTPLQLANYAATIANNGVRLEPHLMQSIVTPTGQVVKTFTPKVMAKITAPQQYWDIIHKGMYLVVNGPQGTASGSFTDAPYKAAGKTGTAQQGNGQNDISVFIAYAPYNDPQIALSVVIPGAGYGATGAVPVARQILDAYFKEHHEFFPASQWTNTSISGK